MTRGEAVKIIISDRLTAMQECQMFGECEDKGCWECGDNKAFSMAIEALSAEAVSREEYEITDRPKGNWVSEIDTGTWFLKCSVCGCRVKQDKYIFAVGENATKCPYCGAELGLGGYLYDEDAGRPSQRGEDT